MSHGIAGSKFKLGDAVFKWTGDYTGSGTVRAISVLPSGKVRYLIGHTIEGGSGEFLHVYAEGNLRAIEPVIPGLASEGGGEPKA